MNGNFGNFKVNGGDLLEVNLADFEEEVSLVKI